VQVIPAKIHGCGWVGFPLVSYFRASR
jgi:hypothetical protein